MTPPIVLQLPEWLAPIVAVIAAALTAAYGCRVRELSPFQHRLSVWLVNWAGMVVCGWLAMQSIGGAELHAIDAAVLTMASAHVVGTLYTWAGGVPDHALKYPGQGWPRVLSDAVLERVVGGRSADDRGQQ